MGAQGLRTGGRGCRGGRGDATAAHVRTLCGVDAGGRKRGALGTTARHHYPEARDRGRIQRRFRLHTARGAAPEREQERQLSTPQEELEDAPNSHEAVWPFLLQCIQDVTVFFASSAESANSGGVILRLHLPPEQCNGRDSVQAFLPRSQMCGSRFDADPHSRVSDKVDVVVKDVWQNDGTIVVSEIGALLVAYADDVVIGEQLTATVDAVTEYGAFVAVENQHPLKGLKGLVHVSEMSWSQVSDPRKLLEPGEEVYVSVKGVDWSKLGLQLSMKELEQDPLFENIDTLFPTNGDDADLSSDDLEAEDSLPGLLSLKTQLEQTEDIDRVAFGRRAVERSAVAQNLEVWLAQLKSNDDAFRVVARDGRLAQEVRVHAGEMSREQLRAVLSQIMEKY